MKQSDFKKYVNQISCMHQGACIVLITLANVILWYFDVYKSLPNLIVVVNGLLCILGLVMMLWIYVRRESIHKMEAKFYLSQEGETP